MPLAKQKRHNNHQPKECRVGNPGDFVDFPYRIRMILNQLAFDGQGQQGCRHQDRGPKQQVIEERKVGQFRYQAPEHETKGNER